MRQGFFGSCHLVLVLIKVHLNWYNVATSCHVALKAGFLEGSIGTAEGRNLLPGINCGSIL